jgi:predicted cupin superfamily sugar epimerase
MQPTQMQAHPEGGRFQEVFRSKTKVAKSDGLKRHSITHIYFELIEGETSKFHKVSSDEVWNLYSGELKLLHWEPDCKTPKEIILSAKTNQFCHVIPAGHWQAAAPISTKVLVGCSVGPGFDFEDFEMIQSQSNEAKQLRAIDQPYYECFI